MFCGSTKRLLCIYGYLRISPRNILFNNNILSNTNKIAIVSVAIIASLAVILGSIVQDNTTKAAELDANCKEKLEGNGYAIIQEQNQIREIMESRDSKGNPDLIC